MREPCPRKKGRIILRKYRVGGKEETERGGGSVQNCRTEVGNLLQRDAKKKALDWNGKEEMKGKSDAEEIWLPT